MKQVLCLSECCLDVIFTGLPKLPADGEEIWSSGFAIRAGGGANTPIMLAGEGVPVRYLTDFAEDMPGNLIERALHSAGVTPVFPEKRPRRTAVSAVLSTEKDRAFASYGGEDASLFDRALIERELAQADILHTFFGYAADLDLFRRCREHGTLLSLDLSWTDSARGDEAALLADCGLVKMNADEARRFTGLSGTEDALKALASLVRGAAVITLGKDGSLAMRHGGDRILRQPAVSPERVLDACGAGDAFAAGLLSALARDESLEAGLLRGAELAARVLALPGGNDAGA